MKGSETMVNICLPLESKTNNVDVIYTYTHVCISHTVHILKVMELLHKDTHHIISNNIFFQNLYMNQLGY